MNWQIPLVALAVFLTGCQSQDEREIKQSLEGYARAYNSRDAQTLASFWTNDGVYTNLSSQESIEGRDAIAQYLIKQAANGSRLAIEVGTIQVDKSGIAVEEGIATISYPDLPAEKTVFRADLVKENGAWALSQVSELEFTEAPSHYEHLKELDWLVGNWVDDDESVTITMSYQWDKNKNYLIQKFTSKLFNYNELEGEQWIGWDPAENTIRSWVFDSDGGFGQSVWSKQDNTWYSRMVFTLPDGRLGTATHTFAISDNDTYLFASVSRDIDGKVLPNIGPFKIVRKK